MCQVIHEERHRLRKVIAKAVVSVLFYARTLEPGFDHGREFLIHEDMVKPEQIIVRRDRVAVGPLVTGPQENAQRLSVVAVFHLFGEIGQVQPHSGPGRSAPSGTLISCSPA